MATTPNRPQPDSPPADVIAYYNANFDVIDDQDRTKIIKNGNIPTMLIGYQKGGFGAADYGIKVAQPGKDVTTAKGPELAFSSAFSNMKVGAYGRVPYPATLANSSNLINVTLDTSLFGTAAAPSFLAYFTEDYGITPPGAARLVPWTSFDLVSRLPVFQIEASTSVYYPYMSSTLAMQLSVYSTNFHPSNDQVGGFITYYVFIDPAQ